MLVLLVLLSSPANLPHPMGALPQAPSFDRALQSRYIASADVVVGADGKVLKCTMQATSGFADIDAKICDRVKSVAFAPATWSDGTPALGRVTVPFAWPAGNGPPTPASDLSLAVPHLPAAAGSHPRTQLSLSIDAAGKLVSCSVVASSGSAVLDAAACKSAEQPGVATPLVGASGAGPSVQSLTVGFATPAKPIFKKDSAYAQYGGPGPYYPERAQRLGVHGSAVLECISDAAGVLNDCVVNAETPQAFGLGVASLRMAQVKWVTVAPGPSTTVEVQIDFQAPR